jgi:hypothetical protein
MTLWRPRGLTVSSLCLLRAFAFHFSLACTLDVLCVSSVPLLSFEGFMHCNALLPKHAHSEVHDGRICRERRLVAVQTTYGVLLPPDMHSSSELSTTFAMSDTNMASSYETTSMADYVGDSSPNHMRDPLLFGSFDEDDDQVLRLVITGAGSPPSMQCISGFGCISSAFTIFSCVPSHHKTGQRCAQEDEWETVPAKSKGRKHSSELDANAVPPTKEARADLPRADSLSSEGGAVLASGPDEDSAESQSEANQPRAADGQGVAQGRPGAPNSSRPRLRGRGGGYRGRGGARSFSHQGMGRIEEGPEGGSPLRSARGPFASQNERNFPEQSLRDGIGNGDVNRDRPHRRGPYKVSKYHESRSQGVGGQVPLVDGADGNEAPAQGRAAHGGRGRGGRGFSGRGGRGFSGRGGRGFSSRGRGRGRDRCSQNGGSGDASMAHPGQKPNAVPSEQQPRGAQPDGQQSGAPRQLRVCRGRGRGAFGRSQGPHQDRKSVAVPDVRVAQSV